MTDNFSLKALIGLSDVCSSLFAVIELKALIDGDWKTGRIFDWHSIKGKLIRALHFWLRVLISIKLSYMGF